MIIVKKYMMGSMYFLYSKFMKNGRQLAWLDISVAQSNTCVARSASPSGVPTIPPPPPGPPVFGWTRVA